MKPAISLVCLLLFLSVSVLSKARDSQHNRNPNPAGRWIKGDELKALFFNQTAIGEYHSVNGGIKSDQFTEYHRPDGTTDYIELGQKTEKGLWWLVGGDRICYRYPGNKVFNRTYCFFIFKREQCYYNYSFGAMSLKGPRNPDWWTSRFIIKGKGGSCEAPVG